MGVLNEQAKFYNERNSDNIRYAINSAILLYLKGKEAIENYKNRPPEQKEKTVKEVNGETLTDIKKAMMGRQTMGEVDMNNNNAPYVKELKSEELDNATKNDEPER